MSYFTEIDLHGLNYNQAKEKLTKTLNSLPEDTGELTVVHGYKGGTVLRELVRKFKHPKIERKVLGLNQGSTIFIIKKTS